MPFQAKNKSRSAARKRQNNNNGRKLTNLRSDRNGSVPPEPWSFLARSIPIFPLRLQAKLRYYDFAQQVAFVAGAGNSRFFSANGLFDPDISGTGHQPMGFDNLMAFYEQATVVSASITVTGIPETVGIRFGLYLSPDTTNITDPIRLVENGLIKTSHTDAAAASGGTGRRTASVSFSVDCARYFNRSKPWDLVNDPDMSNTVAANPVEQVYFAICAWCYYSTSSVGTADYDVAIVYDVIFHEPKKLAIS